CSVLACSVSPRSVNNKLHFPRQTMDSRATQQAAHSSTFGVSTTTPDRKAIVARFPFLLLVARLVVAKQAPVQEQMSIPEHLLQVGTPIPSFIGKATNHNWQHMLAVAASSTPNTTVTNSSSTNQSSEESCFSATMEACFASVDCLICAASGPAYCNEIDVVDCESYWDSLCCTYGTSDACLENTLLVDLVACFGELLCWDGEVD
ncbi:unnamed protein product, partial [Ectocarpus sp. 12 AP-2014]